MMKTENEEEMKCPSCGSNDIRKNGMILKNKGRRIQRFQCCIHLTVLWKVYSLSLQIRLFPASLRFPLFFSFPLFPL